MHRKQKTKGTRVRVSKTLFVSEFKLKTASRKKRKSCVGIEPSQPAGYVGVQQVDKERFPAEKGKAQLLHYSSFPARQTVTEQPSRHVDRIAAWLCLGLPSPSGLRTRSLCMLLLLTLLPNGR
jgi:hypothetical protein